MWLIVENVAIDKLSRFTLLILPKSIVDMTMFRFKFVNLLLGNNPSNSRSLLILVYFIISFVLK